MVFAGVVYTAEHSCANKWLIVFNFVAKTQAVWVVWLYTHWIYVLWQQEDLRSQNLPKLHQCFLTIVLDSSLRMNSPEKEKSPSLLLLLAVHSIIMCVKPPLHFSNQSHSTHWYLRDKKNQPLPSLKFLPPSAHFTDIPLQTRGRDNKASAFAGSKQRVKCAGFFFYLSGGLESFGIINPVRLQHNRCEEYEYSMALWMLSLLKSVSWFLNHRGPQRVYLDF